jgi:hypothetical protein
MSVSVRVRTYTILARAHAHIRAQAELEDRTETLSGIVARRRLRTVKSDIEAVALDAVKKRDVLVTAVQNSLGADLNDTDARESSSSSTSNHRTRRFGIPFCWLVLFSYLLPGVSRASKMQASSSKSES